MRNTILSSVILDERNSWLSRGMEVHILLFVFKQDVCIEMERTRYGGH